MRNQLTTSLFVFFTCLTLTLTASTGSALPQGDPIGKVVAVRGVVTAISANGESRQLSTKAPVFGEDSIDTGSRGRIQLLFTDNTIMSLGQNTQMKIAEYHWSETDAKKAAMKTQVKEGTFRVLGGAITKAAPQNFTTETPTATIGIRGSSYAGKATPDHLSVVLLGGKGVNIFNDKGMEAVTTVGFGSMVAAGQPPMKAFKFTPQDLKGLNGSLSGDKKENKSKISKKKSKKKGSESEQQEQGEADDKQATTSDEESGSDIEQTAASEPTEATEPTTEGTPGEEGQTVTTTSTEDSTPINDEGGEQPTIYGGDISPEDAPPTELPPTFEPPPLADPQDIPLQPEVLVLEAIPPTETTIEVASVIPSNGVEEFVGWLKGIGTSTDGTLNVIDESAFTEVNWYNRKFIGMVDKTDDPNDNSGPVFFFGTVNSDGTITDTRVIGADTVGDEYTSTVRPSIINATGISGQFFDQDDTLIFGFSASGNVRLLEDLSINETWTVDSSGSSVGIDPIDVTAPTGAVNWKGFVTGMSEDISDPNNGRRLFMNNNSNNFTMNINRDSGTVGGSFSASDYSGSGTTINVDIGANGSAYVLDDNLIALLSGSVSNGSSSSLLPGTNYMVTENPDTPLANYVEWGIWEAAYIDPNSTAVYDIHFPGSFWVAGVPTAPGNFPTGNYTYSGKAIAAKITGTSTERLGGTSSFNVNLADINGGGNISGAINLSDGLALSFTSLALASGNFSTNTVAGATSGQINGAFFGPNANATAGNFTADVTTAKYIGVFGANR